MERYGEIWRDMERYGERQNGEPQNPNMRLVSMKKITPMYIDK